MEIWGKVYSVDVIEIR